MDLKSLTIKEARRALDEKEYSALELTDAYLKTIRERDAEIHAYLEVWEKSARKEAKAADEIIARGEPSPLTGIPIAVKDNILIEGRIVSAASRILENYTASYDATVIKKLKEQGVVFLGRTNMDEFALGASTEHSAFGPTKNPHDLSRVPGGTSGGSTAAVSAGMALVALGSDTGGSVRQPSAFCGVVGLKPTYGAVSRFGLIAAASSLDQIGTIGKTVDDAKAVFRGICGHDKNDSTSLPASRQVLHDLTEIKNPGRKVRIGVPRGLFSNSLPADMQERFEESVAILREKGYEISDIELFSDPKVPMAVYYIINPAEVSTNLARFDGIRYGLSVPALNIQEVYAKTRGAGFGPEVRRRILVGTFVLSSGYADAYYRKALAVREIIRADFARVFESVDAIVTPTTPGPAFKFGEKSDPVAMYLEDIFTVPVSLAGVPAISVPSGTVTREGSSLPVGFQIIGAHGNEEMLFSIGNDVERI
ncbi:MAG: Asp-tRNA(Asn)/Glu-tRNA(Gln) amidotransferase subunit GatA [bacterium]|nr:Asp-tRNA(Asn)/Glu-tRNA(Gln) amidotransferase subunit GatA [bacterium]